MGDKPIIARMCGWHPDIDEPIKARVIKGRGSEPVQVRKISVGGVCFCDSEIEGTSSRSEIMFTLVLPSGDKFQFRGSLRYTKKPENRIGICFNPLTEKEYKIIGDYVGTRINEIRKKT